VLALADGRQRDRAAIWRSAKSTMAVTANLPFVVSLMMTF